MFSIVETIERTGIVVTAVPNIWIQYGNLAWPPNVKGLKLKKLRETKASPETNWISVPINRILFENIGKLTNFHSILYLQTFIQAKTKFIC